MKAAIITIGDEILIGQIIDTNSVWLSQQLISMGVDILETCSISDEKNAILDAVERLIEKVDLILVTGGLGPTKDDITKKVLADYFSLPMAFDQTLFNKIGSYFKKIGIPVTEMHRQQCYMPEGIIQLENKMGTAPGMLFQTGSKMLVSMPGVPYEMKWIFENSFTPVLYEHHPELGNIYHRTIKTAGIGETSLAEKIEDITDKLPPDISLAFLPSLGHVKLRLTTKTSSTNNQIVDDFVDIIAQRLGHLVYGFDGISIEQALMRDFKERSLTVATAESCTGGYIAHRITSAPGSSDYYVGSVVAYDNSVKTDTLNVPKDIINSHGAVSEQSVLAMLDGVLELTGADVAVTTSGIAGPGGGSVSKPVGTIWLAWGNKTNQRTKKLQLSKDRLKNIEFTSIVAMNSLRLFLTEL